MKHVTLRISGKVQGVFFRASTRDVAVRLGVNGFVRNQMDGSVYIEAEAEDEKLEKFIAWCRVGPPRATVHQVEVAESGMKHFKSFEIA